MKPKVQIVQLRITSDLEKLWSCQEFRRKNPTRHGQRSNSSGTIIHAIEIEKPDSPFCDSTRFWALAEDDELRDELHQIGEIIICEHLVDIIEDVPAPRKLELVPEPLPNRPRNRKGLL